MTFSKKRTFPFIQQTGMMECGTTSLAMIFKYYGYYDVRSFLGQVAEVNTEGIDLYTLSELAEGFGFETDGFQLDYDHLDGVTLPCIAHYEGHHFVVIYKCTTQKVWIADPAVGKYTLNRQEFEQRWNGIVLVLNPSTKVFSHNELTVLAEQHRQQQHKLWSKYYWSSLAESRKMLRYILFSTVLLQLLGLVLPFFTQTIIDQVLVNRNARLLYAILLGLAWVAVCQVVLTYSRNLLLTQLKVNFERNFFSKFFDHLIRLPQAYFDRHKKEDFINRFQENLKIRQALSPAVLEGVLDFLFVNMYLVVLFIYNVGLGFIALAFVGIYLLMVFLITPRLRRLEGVIFAENVKTMGKFMDTLLGIETVRLLGIEKLKFWQWKNQYTKALNKVLNTEKVYIRLSTLLRSVFFLGQMSIYWVGAYFTFTNRLSIGEYIAFVTIFTILINALNNVIGLWFVFTELSVTFDKINDVLVQQPLDYNPQNKVQVRSPWHLECRALSFRYQQQDEAPVLTKVSCHLLPGQFIGLVGRNGSGKSTLLKLISGFYQHYEGEILVNGIDIKQVKRNQLQQKIAVIPQEVYLFDDTIKANIRYAKPTASNEELVNAAKLADLHDFVEGQYLGYNLKVGENGVNLSGGQKLKIAFARLFLTNPDLIILDEASSALDVETEQIVMHNIRTHFKDKTIISAAHRLHTLRNADQIWVLDQGQLVEQGPHETLYAKKGVYRKFLDTYINF